MTEAPKSNREWQFWGAHDPLYAVSTVAGKSVSGPSPWTIDELRDAGRRYFERVYQLWVGYGVQMGHCVEIGCGSGRITAQLAARFERVTALDVSPHQLERARELLGELNSRTTFALVTAPAIPLPADSCDAVYSCEVFQHFDSDEPAERYLNEAYRVLRRGGTLCLHVPVQGLHPATILSSRLRNSALRLLRELGRRRMMIYRKYSGLWILNTLRHIGFEDPELRVAYNAEHNGFESYFLARKS